MLILLNAQIITDFKFVGEEKVVLFVFHSVYLVDGLSHLEGASRWWSLRVVVGQVDEDVVEYFVDIDD